MKTSQKKLTAAESARPCGAERGAESAKDYHAHEATKRKHEKVEKSSLNRS